ncbi:uncharacterized protein ATC70_009276 [Mucor velutinosus]|uniref:Uncharacterized protein n=1 Tax=Mucor velutinosus TaxID=708070 RepID=A0AAN7DL05_9FUNG|nr:hypothetical protein ATC70_009276 [Mucor velutinosus]
MTAYKFYQEDGINPPVDEYGSGPVNMEVDEVNYPLGDITNYSICADKKPAEKEKVTRDVEMKNAKNKDTSTRAHNVYTDQDKARFSNFIYKGSSLTRKKADDQMNLEYLKKVLLKFAFPHPLIKCISKLMGDNVIRTNINGHLSNEVAKLRDLKQGYSLFPVLYN